MAEIKTGFEGFGKGNKWTPFKNKPVNVNFGSTNYCGVVSKIKQSENVVFLQPIAVMNPSGKKLEIVDKLATVPYNGVAVSSIKQETLREFVEQYNSERLIETTRIILP